MQSYEFVIPGRPVSVHTKDRAAYRPWQNTVATEAGRESPVVPPFWEPGVRLTIVYLFTEEPIDVDNIIKPVQDALEGVLYLDDGVVTDVQAHRRTWTDGVNDERFPHLLRLMWREKEDCVYIRVQDTTTLEDLL